MDTIKELFQGDYRLPVDQPDTISFETLKDSWTKLKNDRSAELLIKAPDLVDPKAIYLKRIQETPLEMIVQFAGFEDAVDNDKNIPQAKRVILVWLRSVYVNVQQMKSNTDSLLLRIEKEASGDFTEAAISIFKRDPKTNKSKKYYRCIGGKKNGRKVANADDCIGVPDPMKKIKFGITKRAKPGQAGLSKKKTQLTNIMSKRIRKANQRLKKARGF